MPKKERTRLILPILAVSVLLLCSGSFAGWDLHRSQRGSSMLLANSIGRVQATEELILIGEQLQKLVCQFLLTGDRSYVIPVSTLRHDIDNWIARADEFALTDEDKVFVDQARTGYDRFLTELDQSVDKPLSMDIKHSTVASLNNTFVNEILQPIRQYQHFNRGQLAGLTTENQSLTDRTGMVLMFLGVSGAAAGLLAGFVVARNVERRLRESELAVTRSEQLATLGRVAAALAHELRNPLTSMRIVVQFASKTDDYVSLDLRDFSILEQEIERLDNCLQGFLDYARPPRPEKRSCAVQSLVRKTVVLIARRAAQVGVKIHDHLPESFIEIEADPGQIQQVLLNLLLNALEASPDGGAVTLNARIVVPSDDHSSGGRLSHHPELVEIEIVDSGIGLPEHLGRRIFDAFESTKETGTGLGLAICARIIDDHGGEIEGCNGADGGAVFTVRLPHVPRISGASDNH